MKNKKATMLACTITLFLVFIFFFRTIFYPVRAYDELMPFNESYLPVCNSFSEMFKLISLLGLHHCFEATNTLYSNITSLRCNPLGNFLQMFIQLVFQKNPVSYHFYSLVLHLINTALVFLIINKVCSRFYSPKEEVLRATPLVVSLLTLIWAIHPVNIESVLFLTNANIVLSYTFVFIVVFIYLNEIPVKFKFVFLFLLFLLALFTAEFHFMLPVILIAYTVAMDLFFNKNSFLKSFITSLKYYLPLLLADLLFFLCFLLSITRVNAAMQPSFKLLMERVFWLSPQILFHFIKLLFLPLKLSIDQSLLVKIGNSLLDPYALFCFVLISFGLLASFISFINSNKRFPFFFITFFLLFLSLVPFSQILSPTYNLASERYLYFPSFILIFGLSHLIFRKGLINQTSILIILFCLLTIFGVRSYIRTSDWKDNITLYSSAIKATDNHLYKAFRYKELVPEDKLFSQFPLTKVPVEYKKLAIENLEKAIVLLKDEIRKYQDLLPAIVKNYGLDPKSRFIRAGIMQSNVDYSLNNNPKKSLELIEPYVGDLSLLDDSESSFYASLLFHNNLLDKAEEVLRTAYKKDPYSAGVFYSLCDLIQIKYGNIDEIEKYTLRAFKYFPYDTNVLFLSTKIYELKGDLNKFAKFSYIYGLRHHSVKDLENAVKAKTKLAGLIQ